MTMQNIDPNAPNYDRNASRFVQDSPIEHWRILPDAIIGGNVIEFKLSHRGNGKLQKDYYDRLIDRMFDEEEI